MKKILIILIVLSLFSCKQHSANEAILQSRIDSLESKLADTYKPGFGEFMSAIQAHHAKLWYAGENQNWKLAAFEMDEIRETFDDVKKYETDRSETQLISMINPPLDSVTSAINLKNLTQFENSYTSLTNTCNACHQAAKFEFNVVKTPTSQMFANQDFKPKQ